VASKSRGRGGSAQLNEPRSRFGPLKSSVVALIVTLGVAVGLVFVERPQQQTPAPAAQKATPVYRFTVVKTYPHDPDAFTQGLVYRDGFLYESTGRNGFSSLRKVQLETGKVLQQVTVDDEYFAEGLVDWKGRLLQLTYTTNIGFIYDLATFARQGTFDYEGEGWGLTHDGSQLIMSDGTSRLRFLNPETLRETARVPVSDGPDTIDRLNELEMVRGELYANIWLTDRIARIEPRTGRVTGWIDLTGLMKERPASTDAVPNGIAYDAAGDRLFVTGKLWPQLFEIRIRE
jgi:glutaminyl-peptide cyclotransferase